MVGNELKLLSDKDQHDKICVITHHVPHQNLICNEFKDHPLNQFFAVNVANNVNDDNDNNVDLWCYGHTHYPSFKKWGKTEYHCNPYGYERENLFAKFDYIINL